MVAAMVININHNPLPEVVDLDRRSERKGLLMRPFTIVRILLGLGLIRGVGRRVYERLVRSRHLQ